MTAVKPLSSLFLKQYIYGQAESGRNLFTGNITIQKLQKQCRSITGMYGRFQFKLTCITSRLNCKVVQYDATR